MQCNITSIFQFYPRDLVFAACVSCKKGALNRQAPILYVKPRTKIFFKLQIFKNALNWSCLWALDILFSGILWGTVLGLVLKHKIRRYFDENSWNYGLLSPEESSKDKCSFKCQSHWFGYFLLVIVLNW